MEESASQKNYLEKGLEYLAGQISVCYKSHYLRTAQALLGFIGTIICALATQHKSFTFTGGVIGVAGFVMRSIITYLIATIRFSKLPYETNLVPYSTDDAELANMGIVGVTIPNEDQSEEKED